jgi:hypothetical protein
MDNTIHFKNYNSGGQTASRWQDSSFFIRLREERLRCFRQMARDKQRRLACQVLQRQVLQLLIDAKQNPVHINQIAAQIGRSPRATTRFLLTEADDLWIGVGGGRLLWMTSLRFLPDRLFH